MLPSKSIELPHVDTFLQRFDSEGTVRAYRADLEGFRVWLDIMSILDIKSFEARHAIQYRAYLASRLSQGSVNRRLSAVKSYINTLIVLGVLNRNPMDAIELYPNKSAALTPGMSDSEASKVLESISHLRDKAIVSILFYMGLRRSEVCKLRIESLSVEAGMPVLIVEGKGGKIESLPIPENVHICIQSYLNTRASIHEASEPLFLAENGKIRHLSGQTIYDIFQRYIKKSAINGHYSPHSARVTCVSNALENGASHIEAQRLGRWTSIKMVTRYNRRRNLKNSAVFAVNYGSKS